MKATTKFKFGTLGVFLGYTAATCGGGFSVGYPTGYHAAAEDAVKLENCLRMLAPVRDEFSIGCSNKTADTLYDGSLNPILQKRDELVERCGLTEETWICEPTRPYDLQNSDFKAVFRKNP